MNGPTFLDASTVFNDRAVDFLFGDPFGATPLNWFFASANDNKFFVQPGEVVTTY